MTSNEIWYWWHEAHPDDTNWIIGEGDSHVKTHHGVNHQSCQRMFMFIIETGTLPKFGRGLPFVPLPLTFLLRYYTGKR